MTSFRTGTFTDYSVVSNMILPSTSKLMYFQLSRFESEIDGFRNASSLVQLVPGRVSPFELSKNGDCKKANQLIVYLLYFLSQ